MSTIFPVVVQFEITVILNQKESRAKAQRRKEEKARAPVNQGLAFFLCATSAFAGNCFFLLYI
jgi:hypothetical protein